MSLLIKGLTGLKVLADLATKQLEESNLASLESKEKGQIDLAKARELIERVSRVDAAQDAAIDQLQQRLSNIESLVARLEARVPGPPPAPLPIGGAGSWIDCPPPKR